MGGELAVGLGWEGGEVGLIEGVEGEGEMMVGVFSSFFICHLRLMSL